jgi:ubiquinone/menaquinone biosynthesis C-methylase UbiE
MQKELALFKELFTPTPNISILHVDNSLDLVNTTLEEIRAFNEGNIKYINFVDEPSARLRATAREYEYVILGNILSYCPNKDKILKLMYKAIENSGNIIILEKKSNNNEEEILTLLDDLGFMASNTIDLFEEFHLFTAKKMHHWGNGL